MFLGILMGIITTCVVVVGFPVYLVAAFVSGRSHHRALRHRRTHRR